MHGLHSAARHAAQLGAGAEAIRSRFEESDQFVRHCACQRRSGVIFLAGAATEHAEECGMHGSACRETSRSALASIQHEAS